MSHSPPPLLSTTILLVRRHGIACMISDGQVTSSASSTVLKRGASKVKRAGKGDVLVGFAGGGADALALFSRFESKLEEYQGNFQRAVVELAMDWRTDRALRQLQAQMVVANRERSFLVMGNGDLLEPDEEGLLAIGSGGNFALAAARALLDHTDYDAETIAREAMKVAADLCVYTNDRFTVETLDAKDAASQAAARQDAMGRQP
ncbi:MAG TPA: ATP-dependent protease subunit HslV [Thermoanaerobaculia bacterium]|nr:ATP-dependent protease subunit HslV [Thermoanaerobaculia bacterium]